MPPSPAADNGGRFPCRLIAGQAGVLSIAVSHASRRRSLEAAMPMFSRYLATVRRATWMPWSPRMAAILMSLKGLEGGSAAMSLRMIARMATDEHSPPVAVLTWLEKKYLNS